MVNLVSVFVGFILGLLASIVVRGWQSRIDEHSHRYNDIRDTVFRAAELATSYWLKDPVIRYREAEAHLNGLVTMLNGLALEIATEYRDDPTVHSQRLQYFFELTTGGEQYEIDERDPNPARASAVQTEAAKLILYFQKYRRQKLTIFEYFRIGFSP
ncbi:MAG: hypothetical protein OXC63_02645 [Aestuariivita sp.]|nr:hypothetical protein [Aestuariivita sp.]MCY4347812.1 hypothetical protein [Aestuariivita sp.]